MTLRSAPISLPETHIHRTPSELQLAADTIHAEYKDVAMYSRLIIGIHNQMQHRHLSEGGGDGNAGVHPLSKKSMEGIIKTMQANDQELEEQQHYDDRDDGDSSWDVAYSLIDEDMDHWSIASSLEAGLPSRQASKDSLSTLLDDVESGDLEDGCFFCIDI